MKKITAIAVALTLAASLMGFSLSASACGCERSYYQTKYTGCGCKKVRYVPSSGYGCCNRECLYYRAMVPCRLF